MGDTKIQWTNKTWNPIRARNITTDERGWYCEHVSEGCRNCYAEKMNVNTYFGNGLSYKASSLPQLELFLDEKILQQPLYWRKPQNVFPCSMTDMFGRFVPESWIIKIFEVVAQANQHTFQCLTKRPERMRDIGVNIPGLLDWHNVWLGVSCEDQKTAVERIPLLLQSPAAVRWISAEPLLGSIDLNAIGSYRGEALTALEENVGHVERPALDWVVVGGESGPGARSMNIDWVRSIVEQCQAASVPVFVKQLGAKPFEPSKFQRTGDAGLNLTNKKGGDPSEWPEDLRVREFPKAVTV